ncbi:protein Spindly [Diachasma alloeum]|uniref:protein Spindly n=1 Tax=Diachasma alloeum TaxID=454923 RepID=UPI0007383D6F|nr:protein Spindly [Diachasma alloeum]
MSNSANESIEDLSKLEADLGTDFDAWKSHMSKLIKANEKYRQDKYSLQCKLEVSSTMQQEMREIQEVLENTVDELKKMNDKKIQELEEKHMEAKKELFSRLSEMEAENLSKSEEIEKLQTKLQELNRKLQLTTNETPIVVQEDSALKEEFSELVSQLLQRDHDIQQLENSLQEVNNENSELKEILRGTKQELSEKNEQLENTRDELIGLKMELAEVKEKPASESSKGNSLFAEVEDRRKKMLDQMLTIRKGYNEAKRVVSIKDAEIRSLKAEKSALIRKWEDDKVDSHYRDTKLMDKYKERISELEQKLQNQKDKTNELENQMRPTDHNFSFFQSMLDTKNKEIEELESKLENVSIQAVLEEEMKHKLSRQLRYWRCKAMSSDAQLVAIKSHLEADPQSTKTEVMQILQQTVDKQSDLEETLDSTKPPPEVIEESLITLEQLMKVPNSSGKVQSSHDNSMFNSSNEDFGDSENFDGSTVKRESMIPNGRDRGVSFNETVPMILIHETGEKSGGNIKREMEELEVSGETENRVPEKETNESNKENKAGGSENKNPSKLKSAFAQGHSSLLVPTNEVKKEKKTLKFTDDTVDPPPRTLKRQVTPKYPIVFVSNKPKKA